MATYLMSYPGPTWYGGGGPEAAQDAGGARRALDEWLQLCDAITRAGGQILVLPPPAVDPPLVELVYAAGLGQLLGTSDRPVFLEARPEEPARRGEREFVRLLLADLGVATRGPRAPWAGQLDFLSVGGNRFIAVWGPGSARACLDDLRPLLPPGARLLEVALRPPFRHGSQCLGLLVNRAGDGVLLAHAAALADRSLADLRRFVGDGVEVYPLEADDAARQAAGAAAVAGTALLPSGLSTTLRGHLVRRGFVLVELELPELLGAERGLRTLLNELRGLVPPDDAPTYVMMRDELLALAAGYGGTAA